MSRRDPGPERGIALLVVLLLLTILLLMAFEFAFTSRTEVEMAGNYRESAQAYYLALTAMDRAIEELTQPADFCFRDEETGEVYLARNPDPPLAVAELVELARENIVRRGLEVDQGYYSYSLRDEEGLFQLNRASRETLIQLMTVLGVQIGAERDEIVDSIMDWLDADELRGLNGAEDDYYADLEIPYSTRGSRFEAIEELTLVRGITADLFYGYEDQPGLRDLITIWGNHRTPNRYTASFPVLVARHGEAEAQQIRDQREGLPLEPGMGRTQREVLSSYFTILAEGQVLGSRTYRQIRAVVQVIGRTTGGASTVQVIHWDDAATSPPRRVIH